MKFKKHPPYQHQMQAINLSLQKPDLALFWDVGAGKTFGVINILRVIFGQKKRVARTLILSPVVTLQNWKKEFIDHSYVDKSSIVVCDKSGATRLKKLNQQLLDKELQYTAEKIVLINYEALVSDEVFKILCHWQPEVVICDESHLIKNPKSKRGRRVVTIGDLAERRFMLTGTAILNNVMDIWNQFRFLDKGATFGKNFYAFRGAYFMDKNHGFAHKQNHFPDYILRQDKEEEVNRLIYEKAHRVKKSECLDLPPLIKLEKPIEMVADQKKAYKEMEKEFITFVKSKSGENKAVVAQLAITKALRLLQICSGFVNTEDGETVIFKKNPKAEMVKEILEQISTEHKTILWCSFKKDYEILGKLCTEMNLKHCFLTGSMTSAQKNEAMKQFETDQDTRVIIANRRAGGIGINLIEASYSIVYSRNFSLGEEIQSEGRNYRGGSQKHKQIVKIDLVTQGTIEELVIESLKNKQNISDKIIDLAYKLS